MTQLSQVNGTDNLNKVSLKHRTVNLSEKSKEFGKMISNQLVSSGQQKKSGQNTDIHQSNSKSESDNELKEKDDNSKITENGQKENSLENDYYEIAKENTEIDPILVDSKNEVNPFNNLQVSELFKVDKELFSPNSNDEENVYVVKEEHSSSLNTDNLAPKSGNIESFNKAKKVDSQDCEIDQLHNIDNNLENLLNLKSTINFADKNESIIQAENENITCDLPNEKITVDNSDRYEELSTVQQNVQVINQVNLEPNLEVVTENNINLGLLNNRESKANENGKTKFSKENQVIDETSEDNQNLTVNSNNNLNNISSENRKPVGNDLNPLKIHEDNTFDQAVDNELISSSDKTAISTNNPIDNKLHISFKEVIARSDEKSIPHRNDQILMAIKSSLANKKSEVSLNLYPEGLDIKIKVEFTQGRPIEVTFFIDQKNKEVLEKIRSDISVLEKALERIQESDNSKPNFHFEDGGNQSSGYNESSNHKQLNNNKSSESDNEDKEQEITKIYEGRVHNSMPDSGVDIRV